MMSVILSDVKYVYNDKKVSLPNVKAVDQTQAELYSLKVEMLGGCTRPFYESGLF